MTEPETLNRYGMLDDSERRVRPAEARRVSFEALFQGSVNFTGLVPIESVRAGDEQVLAARGRGHLELPAIDIGTLADFPTVRSLVASTPVETAVPLIQVEELLTHAVQCRVPTAGTFANLPGLKKLSIGTALGVRALPIDLLPKGLEALRTCRHVLPRGLEQRADMGTLLRFERVRQLAVTNCWPSDTVAPLAGLTELTRLRCDAPGGWAKLKSCEKLEEVAAVTARMANLRAWRSWTNLKSLVLTGKGVGSLEGIEAFRRLRRLELVMMTITSLDPLRDLPDLEEVEVRGTQTVTNLSALGALPKLKRLTVNWSGGGFRDIVHVDSIRPLAKAGALEELTLEGTIIDDGDLSPLAGLPGLRRLRVYGELGPAVAALRRARPDIDVLWREPPKPSGERVGLVHVQPPVAGSADWWIADDLTQLLHVSTNYAAESKIKTALKQEEPNLLIRLRFDTEAEAIVILAESKPDICAVAQLIGRLNAS